MRANESNIKTDSEQRSKGTGCLSLLKCMLCCSCKSLKRNNGQGTEDLNKNNEFQTWEKQALLNSPDEFAEHSLENFASEKKNDLSKTQKVEKFQNPAAVENNANVVTSFQVECSYCDVSLCDKTLNAEEETSNKYLVANTDLNEVGRKQNEDILLINKLHCSSKIIQNSESNKTLECITRISPEGSELNVIANQPNGDIKNPTKLNITVEDASNSYSLSSEVKLVD